MQNRPSDPTARALSGALRRVPRLRALAVAITLAGCGGAAGTTLSPRPAPVPVPGHALYDTDVSFDFTAGTLEGRSTIRMVLADSTSPGVELLLNRGLQVRSITGPGIRSHRMETSELAPVWNLIRVAFEEGVARGSSVVLDVAWAGTPELPSDGVNRITPEYVELNLDSQWHPVVASLDHVMTGTVRVALPGAWRVAASGGVVYRDGAHVIYNEVPQVDVAFSAAPNFQTTQSRRFTALHRGADRDAAAPILRAAENCAEYLDASFGSRDLLPRGTLVLAGRTGPGYARKNYVVLSNVNPNDSVAVHGFLCHELAHYWTRSAGSFSPHHWMTEAFPEYIAARFSRDRFGAAAFGAQVARWEEGGRAHGPVWTPASTRRPSYFLMYRRGPWLLSRLEERIGTERFDRFVARYMTEGVRTTEELLERLEAVAGAEAAEWFRAELAKAGPPSSST